jgi:hypothetical protein
MVQTYTMYIMYIITTTRFVDIQAVNVVKKHCKILFFEISSTLIITKQISQQEKKILPQTQNFP